MFKRLFNALVEKGIISGDESKGDIYWEMLEYITKNPVRLGEPQDTLYRCTDLLRFVTTVQEELLSIEPNCFVIELMDHLHDETEEPLYWSNEMGWVSRDSAMRFTEDERKAFNLPVGGRWSVVGPD